MLSEYRIEKDRLPVVVVTTTGGRHMGEIFVQAYARHRSGREEPHDVLNAPDPFFPLALRDGETLLIAKSQVREVEIIGELSPDATAPAARPAAIELSLGGAYSRVGRVYLEVPFDRPRLLDFLNRLDQRFLALHTDDGVRFINIGLIEHVRQLE